MLVHAWLAVAVAVAVTRHGLYEIDRLFNRTLVYVVLTALLAGTYALVALLAGSSPAARRSPPRPARWRPRSRSALCVTASRPPSTGASLAARVDAVRLLRDFLDDVATGAASRRSRRGAAARARRPARRGGLPAARDRRLRGPHGQVLDALRDDGRARSPIGHDDREVGVLLHDRRWPSGPTCCARCSTPRRWRSSAPAAGRAAAAARRGRVLRTRIAQAGSRSAAGSSATCTTARSSGS